MADGADYWHAECVKLQAEVERLRKPPCVWTEDDEWSGTYYTSCDGVWTLPDGNIAENEVKFCPRCGGEVQEAALKAAGGIDGRE